MRSTPTCLPTPDPGVTLMIADTDPPLIQQWRRRLAGRHSKPRGRRPLGALGFLTNGPVFDGLIEIEKLVLVVLYDEPFRSRRCPLRLVGFSGKPVPWGVRWGGRRGNKFFKDLSLAPDLHAVGQRIDTGDADLLQLGLRLEQQLQRHLRDRWLPVQRSPQLPRIWAGFRRSDCNTIYGDGPELESIARRRRAPAQHVLQSSKRGYQGLVLYPLEWVSHHWQRAALILADISYFPRRQVFSLKDFPDDLQGYRGAAEYDLYRSRFRSGGRRRRRHQRRVGSKALAGLR